MVAKLPQMIFSLETKLAYDPNANSSSQYSSTTYYSKSAVYILSLIPAIGIFVALIIIICYDCHAFKATVQCFCTVGKLFVQKPKKAVL